MKDGELKKKEGKKKKEGAKRKKSEGPQLGKSGNSSNPTTNAGKIPNDTQTATEWDDSLFFSAISFSVCCVGIQS